MRKLFFSVLLLLLSVGFAQPALALTVSPAKLEIAGDPGAVVTGSVEIFNEQSEAKTFYTSFENFEPRGESGAPYFVGAKDGLATWMTTVDQITLQPGEHQEIPYTVKIPASADPGGYFASIFFGSQPGVARGDSDVVIGGKVGILVLLRVNGEVAEQGGLIDFQIKDHARVVNHLPVAFEYRLNNAGADRIVPKGEITVRNIVGGKTATLTANKTEGSVLPGSTRKFGVNWSSATGDADAIAPTGFFALAGAQWHDFHLGWYTAHLNIVWGQNEQVANRSYHFFIFPWQLLSLLLGALLIVVGGGRVLIRKYNRWIIANAGKAK